MIETMAVRNLSPATQRACVHAVAKFSRFCGRSPDRLGLEDAQAFQVHLVASGVSWPLALSSKDSPSHIDAVILAVDAKAKQARVIPARKRLDDPV
jgi:hypothetical protein